MQFNSPHEREFGSSFLVTIPKRIFHKIWILDSQQFVLLVLVVPLIASLAFENLFKFYSSVARITKRCPLVLSTVSNSAPAIE